VIYEERKVTFTEGNGREPYSVRLVITIEDGMPKTGSICICSGQEVLVELSIESAILLNHQIGEAVQENDRIIMEYVDRQRED